MNEGFCFTLTGLTDDQASQGTEKLRELWTATHPFGGQVLQHHMSTRPPLRFAHNGMARWPVDG